VVMPSDIIRELRNLSGGQIVFELNCGIVSLDEYAIQSVDVSGVTVGLTFTQIPSTTYPKFGECYVYDISMLKDGSKVETRFGGDPATIAINFNPEPGEDVTKLKAAYVYGDGNALLIRDCTFVDDDTDSAVVIKAKHMSVFMFMFHDSEYISAGGIDTVFVVVFIVILLILAGAVAFLTFNANAAEKLCNMFKRNKQPPMSPPGQEPYGQYYQYDQYNGNQYR